ncbi:MAG TPA: peptide chain release factor N(5)-glutamine methyltransferase [Terriglobales bacterium]|jgi:release factor glutamine methyltransferase|nr:peptide chain release factor N(5)-glutamine methyltransferase [Terriglobales bacterium]
MQLRQAIQTAIQRLEAAHVGSPRMNAELLAMFVLGCDRAYLYAHDERALTKDEMARYDDALGERAGGVPAQYITGHQEFWGMDVIVSPAVLIPRPETEHVIETVLALARDQPPQNMVDVGTGSGCIALALAKEFPQARVHATDISAEALEIARANAARHQLQEHIQFHQTDLLAGMEQGALDYVVSNPPYIGDWEADSVEAQVRRFEPRLALFAGPSGLEVFARLVPQARRALQHGGWLVMEIGHSGRERVCELLKDWEEIRITNDLQGIARVVAARR